MGPGHELRKLRWICRPATLPADSAAAAPLKGLDGRAAELADKRVFVFGLGAVGGICFAELARLGVGHLYGFDIDRYGDDSWRTQPMRRLEDAAQKAVTQARIASQSNPACSVTTAIGFAQDVPLSILHRADLMIVAGDNLELAVWAGNMAAVLGVPLLIGAVEGRTWLAACRGFDLTDPEAACPGCGISNAEWRTLSSRAGCDPQTLRAQGIEPTRTLPFLCGAAAMMTASQAAMTLLGMEQRLRGEEATFCLLSQKVFRTRFVRNPACPCPHQRWTVTHRPESPTELTLRKLLDRQTEMTQHAICADGSTPVQVRGEADWCSFTFCPGCGQFVSVRRFAAAGDRLGTCECGRPLRASPVGISSVLPQDELRCRLDTPLSQLSFSPGDAIGIARDCDPWHYVICGTPPLLESSGDH